MSVEVQVETTEDPEVPARMLPTPAAPKPQQPLWRRRRYQITGSVLVMAVIAVFVGNNFLARQYTPEGAVREYMTALQAADAAKAWGAIQVTAPTAPVAATVADRNALQAALAAGRPDIKDFTVTSTNQLNSTTTSVEVTYDTSKGSKQAKFLVQRSGQTHLGIYPVWHLVITPTILEISLPTGSNGVAIDGKAIALPDGKSTVAVLPVVHELQFNGTAMLTAQSVRVDAFYSLAQSVAYKPVLTPAALGGATAAIKTAFANCAKGTSSLRLPESGCPQDAGITQPTSGHWSVVGDPSQDLTVGFGQDLSPMALGHYQMVFTYDDFEGTNHQASAGGYLASLVLSATDVTVGAIQPTQDAPGLQRPAGATDQAATSLVAAGLANCAKSTAEYLADCPQKLIDVLPTNITWSMTGDPMAGASVNFDSSTGIFSVHGNLPMTASYQSGWFSKTRASFATSYTAFLLWDGQAFQLINIQGDF
ncbi:MAG: hypothetical protein ACYDA0_11080 [Candidatus Dormibacteraceae bacterium]